MIINDLNIISVIIDPPKANSILIVDANAELARPITP